jgi:fatty-acyl-CoA synthase
MIIRGGENICPRRSSRPCTPTWRSPTWPSWARPTATGEQVAAFIWPAPGHTATEQELAAYCRTHLAAHKTPRHWVFTDAFPLTASGKV